MNGSSALFWTPENPAVCFHLGCPSECRRTSWKCSPLHLPSRHRLALQGSLLHWPCEATALELSKSCCLVKSSLFLSSSLSLSLLPSLPGLPLAHTYTIQADVHIQTQPKPRNITYTETPDTETLYTHTHTHTYHRYTYTHPADTETHYILHTHT